MTCHIRTASLKTKRHRRRAHREAVGPVALRCRDDDSDGDEPQCCDDDGDARCRGGDGGGDDEPRSDGRATGDARGPAVAAGEARVVTDAELVALARAVPFELRGQGARMAWDAALGDPERPTEATQRRRRRARQAAAAAAADGCVDKAPVGAAEGHPAAA